MYNQSYSNMNYNNPFQIPQLIQQQFYPPQAMMIQPIQTIEARHLPNLNKIQYYAILEVEVNSDDRELRLDEIIEMALILVCNGDTMFHKQWIVKPTVYSKISLNSTNRLGLIDENFRDKLTIDQVLIEVQDIIGKLPLSESKDDLVFVSMFEETFCNYLRSEENFKNFKLKPYMQNFISIYNNLPPNLKQDSTDQKQYIINALNIENHHQNIKSHLKSAFNLSYDTAHILQELLKQGFKLNNLQRYTQPINLSKIIKEQVRKDPIQTKTNQQEVYGKINQRNSSNSGDVVPIVDQGFQQIRQKDSMNHKYDDQDRPQNLDSQQKRQQSTQNSYRGNDISNFQSRNYQDKVYSNQNKFYDNKKEVQEVNNQWRRPVEKDSNQNVQGSFKQSIQERSQNNNYSDMIDVQSQRQQQQKEKLQQNLIREVKYERIDANQTQNTNQIQTEAAKQVREDLQQKIDNDFDGHPNQFEDQQDRIQEKKFNFHTKLNNTNKQDNYRSKSRDRKHFDHQNSRHDGRFNDTNDQYYEKGKQDYEKQYNEVENRFQNKKGDQDNNYAKHRHEQWDQGQEQKQFYQRKTISKWENDFYPQAQTTQSKFEYYWNDQRKNLKHLSPHSSGQNLDYIVILHLNKIGKASMINELGVMIYDTKKNELQKSDDSFFHIIDNSSQVNDSVPLYKSIEFLDEFLLSHNIIKSNFVFATIAYPQAIRQIIDSYKSSTQKSMPFYWYKVILLPELHCQLIDDVIRTKRPTIYSLANEVGANNDQPDSPQGKLYKSGEIVQCMSRKFKYWGAEYVSQLQYYKINHTLNQSEKKNQFYDNQQPFRPKYEYIQKVPQETNESKFNFQNDQKEQKQDKQQYEKQEQKLSKPIERQEIQDNKDFQ